MVIKKVKPKKGQESVWDYPRPPALEKTTKHIKIVLGGVDIFSSNDAYRILETSHPPTYYLPVADFKDGTIIRNDDKSSFCEFKGRAHYYHLKGENLLVENAGWGYDNPTNPYQELKSHVCVYAQYMDDCYINDEKIVPQPGGFYGGWITEDVVGPFKGEPGTWGW